MTTARFLLNDLPARERHLRDVASELAGSRSPYYWSVEAVVRYLRQRKQTVTVVRPSSRALQPR